MLGIFSRNDLTYTVPDYSGSHEILDSFLTTAIHTCEEVAIAIGLIVVFFLLCRISCAECELSAAAGRRKAPLSAVRFQGGIV